MSYQLLFLLLTAVLAASLWIPFVVGVTTTGAAAGSRDPFLVPLDPLAMKPWVARAYRAHLNLIEQFLPFAVVVLIGEVRGASSPWLGALAAAFFTLRVAHAYGMISGRARMPLRPIIFSVAYLVVIAYAALLAVV